MTAPDSPSATEESLAEHVSTDQVFALLSHPQRRFVLASIARREEPETIASLAEAFVERCEGEPGAGSTRDPDDVRIELHHVHAPKLADAGLVAFDPASGAVSPPEDDPGPAELAPLLPSSEGGAATNVSGSRT